MWWAWAAGAIGLVAASYGIGHTAGSDAGYQKGYESGYRAATATLRASHQADIARGNEIALQARLDALARQKEQNDARQAVVEAARAKAAAELTRIASDRQRLAGRVQQLLQAGLATPGDHQGCTTAGLSESDAAARSAAATARGLLLERVGKNLAGLAGDADTTLAQFEICYRLASEQKEKLAHAVLPAVH